MKKTVYILIANMGQATQHIWSRDSDNVGQVCSVYQARIEEEVYDKHDWTFYYLLGLKSKAQFLALKVPVHDIFRDRCEAERVCRGQNAMVLQMISNKLGLKPNAIKGVKWQNGLQRFGSLEAWEQYLKGKK